MQFLMEFYGMSSDFYAILAEVHEIATEILECRLISLRSLLIFFMGCLLECGLMFMVLC